MINPNIFNILTLNEISESQVLSVLILEYSDIEIINQCLQKIASTKNKYQRELYFRILINCDNKCNNLETLNLVPNLLDNLLVYASAKFLGKNLDLIMQYPLNDDTAKLLARGLRGLTGNLDSDILERFLTYTNICEYSDIFPNESILSDKIKEILRRSSLKKDLFHIIKNNLDNIYSNSVSTLMSEMNRLNEWQQYVLILKCLEYIENNSENSLLYFQIITGYNQSLWTDAIRILSKHINISLNLIIQYRTFFVLNVNLFSIYLHKSTIEIINLNDHFILHNKMIILTLISLLLPQILYNIYCFIVYIGKFFLYIIEYFV